MLDITFLETLVFYQKIKNNLGRAVYDYESMPELYKNHEKDILYIINNCIINKKKHYTDLCCVVKRLGFTPIDSVRDFTIACVEIAIKEVQKICKNT